MERRGGGLSRVVDVKSERWNVYACVEARTEPARDTPGAREIKVQ